MRANRMLNLITTGLLLSASLATLAVAEDAAPPRPDLTGHWVLNEKASEFPRPGGGGFGGGGGGRGMRDRKSVV